MLIIRDASPATTGTTAAVVALGNFDGLHLGHQAVIAKAVSLAKQSNTSALLVTFEPHPRRIFRPELETLRIFPVHQKMRLLQGMGIDCVRVIRFTRAFSQTTAEAFIRDILHKELRVSQVVTGEDFIFGHNRTGDVAYLQSKARHYGFGMSACPPVLVAGERCSSTRIRSLLAAGKVGDAALLLGRPYGITGRVVTGDKRGRELGFPTANIVPAAIFTPATGIYAVRVKLRGTWVNGVASLGLNPTFGGKQLRLESYLFDWQQDIYGERIEVQLIQRLREERKFDSAAALTAAMREDCEQAKAILY